jgi:hypothetical protein
MGRKKGKQSGSFGSKLNRSKYLTEILQQQYENRTQGQLNKRRADSIVGAPLRSFSSSSSSPYIPSTHSASVSKPRNAINLNQLRGLIRERILEDRVLDANQRRARLFSTSTGRSSSQRDKEVEDNRQRNRDQQQWESLRNEIRMIHAGWLLTYDHRAALAGIESKLSMVAVQSLERWTINVLASVMREYVDACGVDYMHGRVAELPGYVIAKLSSKCRDVTDDIAYILGHHPHVERLALNGSDDMYQSCSLLEDEYEVESSESLMKFTTKGLYCMINAENDTCYVEECKDMDEVIESWETLSFHEEKDSYSLSNRLLLKSSKEIWSNNLERLELRSFHATDSKEFIGFLMKCSKLTHLSLAYSLNSITGPRVLLLHDLTLGKGTKTILDVLPRLQVLDLHGCQWLHLDLLKEFMDRIMRSSSPNSLELICIGGCSSYVSQECPSLNTRYSNISRHIKKPPLLCISPPP